MQKTSCYSKLRYNAYHVGISQHVSGAILRIYFFSAFDVLYYDIEIFNLACSYRKLLKKWRLPGECERTKVDRQKQL